MHTARRGITLRRSRPRAVRGLGGSRRLVRRKSHGVIPVSRPRSSSAASASGCPFSSAMRKLATFSRRTGSSTGGWPGAYLAISEVIELHRRGVASGNTSHEEFTVWVAAHCSKGGLTARCTRRHAVCQPGGLAAMYRRQVVANQHGEFTGLTHRCGRRGPVPRQATRKHHQSPLYERIGCVERRKSIVKGKVNGAL